jgi:hypothetical protein
MPASSSSNGSSRGGNNNGRGRGRGRGNGRGGRYALANGGNLCSAHSNCNRCHETVVDLRSKLASARAGAQRSAGKASYFEQCLDAMERGDTNTTRFATSGNQFILNSCALESEGDIEGMAPCGICKSPYTKGGDHNPVMLFADGCGHTVCKTCFPQLSQAAIDGRKDLQCPYCRRAVTRAACVRM